MADYTEYKSGNKSKFKSKAAHKDHKPKSQKKVVPAVQVPPKLESNWNKYDDPSDDDSLSNENAVPVGKDFGLIADAPYCQSGYFQFKKDKTFLHGNTEKLPTDDLFKFDLNLIGLSLDTIPFYKRCGLSETIFNPDIIESMNQKALANVKTYETYLKSASELIPTTQLNQVKAVKDIIKTDAPPSQATTSPTKDQVDLENWLDDILQ